MQEKCKWMAKACSKNRFQPSLSATRKELICNPDCRFYAEHVLGIPIGTSIGTGGGIGVVKPVEPKPIEPVEEKRGPGRPHRN